MVSSEGLKLLHLNVRSLLPKLDLILVLIAEGYTEKIVIRMCLFIVTNYFKLTGNLKVEGY